MRVPFAATACTVSVAEVSVNFVAEKTNCTGCLKSCAAALYINCILASKTINNIFLVIIEA